MYRVLLTTVVPKDTFRGASFDRGVADLLLEHVRTAKVRVNALGSCEEPSSEFLN